MPRHWLPALVLQLASQKLHQYEVVDYKIHRTLEEQTPVISQKSIIRLNLKIDDFPTSHSVIWDSFLITLIPINGFKVYNFNFEQNPDIESLLNSLSMSNHWVFGDLLYARDAETYYRWDYEQKLWTENKDFFPIEHLPVADGYSDSLHYLI